MRRRVCVVGAGIGGLTSAIALRRAGFDVVVHEKDPTHRTTGGGLAVQSNAMFALQFAGMAHAVADAGVQVRDNLTLRNAQGDVIKDVPIVPVTREVFARDVPSICVSRQRLHEALLNLIDEDAIILGSELVRFREDARGLSIDFSDGRQERADLLIGADGIRSCTRRHVLGPEPEPRYVGYGTAIGLCHPKVPIELGENSWYWGPDGQMFGVHDVGHGQAYWWSVKLRAQGSLPSEVTAREEALRYFGSWNPQIRALLEATSDQDARRLDEHDRPPSARWGRGRVTLLGDAAHPMAAFLGQGASQAIEDAIILTAFLVESRDGIEPALRRYERERRRRTAKLVRTARVSSQLQLLTRQWACRVRDGVGRALPMWFVEPLLRGVFKDGFSPETCRMLGKLESAVS